MILRIFLGLYLSCQTSAPCPICPKSPTNRHNRQLGADSGYRCTHEPIPHWVFASKNAVTLCKSIECVLLGLAQNKYNPYFLSSHLLHSSRSLTDGRTPNSIFAISRYKNPSSGTLHFLHFLVITDSLCFCVLHLKHLYANEPLIFFYSLL